MSDGAGVDPLARDVLTFATQVMDTLRGFLGREIQVGVNVGEDVAGGVRYVTVFQEEPTGIALSIDKQVVFRLVLSYRCEWNASRRYFAVSRSTILINFEGRNEPFMHFDYLREAGSQVPVAHLNFHAHRDEAMYALMLASRKRGKGRSKKLDGGKVPAVSDLHIPLGGHRFRPALEDVLEMLWMEFGLDVAEESAAQAIADGRRAYRIAQVRSAVTDAPEEAAEVLRDLDYDVSLKPSAAPRTNRDDRLTRY